MLFAWGENKNKLEAEAVSSSGSDGEGLLCCLPVAPQLRKRDTEASEQPGKCLRQLFPVPFRGCQTPSQQRQFTDGKPRRRLQIRISSGSVIVCVSFGVL